MGKEKAPPTHVSLLTVSRFYEECPDLRRLVRQVVFYQNEYNLGGGDKEMSLVFLPDTVRHLLRIARILRQPRGNALVIGLAGEFFTMVTKVELDGHVVSESGVPYVIMRRPSAELKG